MGFRFRRKIGLGRLLRFNFGKRRVSTSVGRPGLTVNLRGDRVRETIGAPGTGLSYRIESRLGPGAAILLLVLIALPSWHTQ